MTSIYYYFLGCGGGENHTDAPGGSCCVTPFKTGQLLVSGRAAKHVHFVSELSLAVAQVHLDIRSC